MSERVLLSCQTGWCMFTFIWSFARNDYCTGWAKVRYVFKKIIAQKRNICLYFMFIVLQTQLKDVYNYVISTYSNHCHSSSFLVHLHWSPISSAQVYLVQWSKLRHSKTKRLLSLMKLVVHEVLLVLVSRALFINLSWNLKWASS